MVIWSFSLMFSCFSKSIYFIPLSKLLSTSQNRRSPGPSPLPPPPVPKGHNFWLRSSVYLPNVESIVFVSPLIIPHPGVDSILGWVCPWFIGLLNHGKVCVHGRFRILATSHSLRLPREYGRGGLKPTFVTVSWPLALLVHSRSNKLWTHLPSCWHVRSFGSKP